MLDAWLTSVCGDGGGGSSTVVLALPSPLPPPTCSRDHHKQFHFHCVLDTKFWKLIVFGVCARFFLQPNEEQARASENIYISVSILISHGQIQEEKKKSPWNTNEENNYIPIAVCNFLLLCRASELFVEFHVSQMLSDGMRALFYVRVCVLIWILALPEWNHFFYLFRRFYFGNLNCCCFYYFTVLCFLFLFFSRLRSRFSLCWSFLPMNIELVCPICIVYTNIYIRSPLPFAQRRKTDIYIHKDIVVVYRSFDFIGFCSSKVN